MIKSLHSSFYLSGIFFFFKKRLFLLKFFKNFKKRSLKKKFLKNFICLNSLHPTSYFFKSQALESKFPSRWNLLNFKTNFFIKSHKVLKKVKKPWYLYVFKKFSFLKKLLSKNFFQLVGVNFHKKLFLKLFSQSKNFSNLNFFYLWYFKIINLHQWCFLFFSTSHINYFIKKSLFFIEGCMCKNFLFSLPIFKLFTIQLTWSLYSLILFKSFSKKTKFVFKKKKFFRWLYFFRKKVQRQNPKKKFPRWLITTLNYKLFNLGHLETSFLTLSLCWIPHFSLPWKSFFLRYVNIYNHRLYLWKYII